MAQWLSLWFFAFKRSSFSFCKVAISSFLRSHSMSLVYNTLPNLLFSTFKSSLSFSSSLRRYFIESWSSNKVDAACDLLWRDSCMIFNSDSANSDLSCKDCAFDSESASYFLRFNIMLFASISSSAYFTHLASISWSLAVVSESCPLRLSFSSVS